MLQPNCDPKVRFSYFLPDGILSSAAAEIIVPNPFDSKDILRCIGDHSIDTVCLSMSMEDRSKEIELAYYRRHKSLSKLEKSGYIISKKKKSTASKTKSQSVVLMTKSSLYLLTETEDQDTELKRLTESGFFEKENYETFLGNISYQDLSPDAIYWRRSLNELDAKKKDSPEAAVEFVSFLQKNLARYGYSPLVCESLLAKEVRLGLHGGPSQTDSQMRNMEIEAMFKFNRFLTCIDRPRIVMRDVEQDLDEYRNNPDSVLWLSTFTLVTLRDWYNAHLSAYTFLGADPERDDYVSREVWLRTPAYYRLNNLNGLVDCLKEKNEISTRNVMGYNATGVAVGVANNLTNSSKNSPASIGGGMNCFSVKNLV